LYPARRVRDRPRSRADPLELRHRRRPPPSDHQRHPGDPGGLRPHLRRRLAGRAPAERPPPLHRTGSRRPALVARRPRRRQPGGGGGAAPTPLGRGRPLQRRPRRPRRRPHPSRAL